MADFSFMDKLRSFLGLRQEPPRNDFRNPIWSSDDEDDGDELYARQNIDPNPLDLHDEFARQMNDMFRTFGSLFGDIKLFHENLTDAFTTMTEQPEQFDEPSDHSNIRDYYLKPGYHSRKPDESKDIDLDGKISSHEISGLLKKKDDNSSSIVPFDGNLVPGRSFCQTIITTSVKKPDGTVETRKIVKKGNEVVEETITTTEPSGSQMVPPFGSNMDSMGPMGDGSIYNTLSSLFRNFY